MIRAIMFSVALVLTGCTEIESVADRTGRQAATSVVTEVIAINFPQVPKPLIEAFTGCVVDNAQALEVRELAKASVVGVDETTVATVRNVLSRPETQTCLRNRATTVF
ncbi:hypothetical protein [Sulfitobacter guttiformis]|uniref:Lipoprotein n=1 Tax=Sulfitobacter guttiformis TaxID=74349 RepID=A0A420DUF9_9RHOB|nr:hypothetical protein [Sulfitobacter guttiformis]KIN71376.1 Lipoprotein [Sulfitobacter guttiformis KCTC 32187]RKE97823.1 hypothetical protein C8N30_2452 [Sulfitobacter guttiformis]